MEEEEKTQNIKLEYFDLKQATNDIGDALGAKEKSIAGAKLFGKTLFNTILFAGKTAVEKGKEISEQKEKHFESSEKKLKNLKENGSFAEKAAASAILKDRNIED
ncbi:MAG: hypothetical protein VCA57_02555 [Pseudomonas sp.]|uniref:hypothetical protein n=1 Tax=Pseudomonas sp. TaxID=306 RepID=UPI00398194DA